MKITIDESVKKEDDQEEENSQENTRDISPEEVMHIFSKISDLDCQLLGFDPKYSRPEWMIIKNLAVCPPQVRPSVSVDSSLRSQDDLTHQYNQILKCNELLREEKNKKEE